MMRAYRYDSQKIATGETMETSESAGLPIGWTRTPPPDIPAGKFGLFSGAEGWRIIDARPPSPPEPVPESVTKRQAKEALIRQGLHQAALDAIAAIPDATERVLAENYWSESQTFERSNATLVAMATTGLGMTEAELDDLFRYAATL